MPRPDASAKLKAARPKEGPSKVIIGAVVVVVIIIAAVVAVIVNNQSGSGNGAVPRHALANGGGVVVSGAQLKPNAPRIDLWEDFQCPACKALEQASGQKFVDLARSGQIKLVVHMMSFLDQHGGDSSLRAATASMCAADVGKFAEYHSTIYANQPPEGVGYTDAQLRQFARNAGIDGQALRTFNSCYKSKRYEPYAKNIQVQADKEGIKESPTIQVNGKTLEGELRDEMFMGPKGVEQALAASTK